jgi:hypothetical protein
MTDIEISERILPHGCAGETDWELRELHQVVLHSKADGRKNQRGVITGSTQTKLAISLLKRVRMAIILGGSRKPARLRHSYRLTS